MQNFQVRHTTMLMNHEADGVSHAICGDTKTMCDEVWKAMKFTGRRSEVACIVAAYASPFGVIKIELAGTPPRALLPSWKAPKGPIDDLAAMLAALPLSERNSPQNEAFGATVVLTPYEERQRLVRLRRSANGKIDNDLGRAELSPNEQFALKCPFEVGFLAFEVCVECDKEYKSLVVDTRPSETYVVQHKGRPVCETHFCHLIASAASSGK